MAIELRPLSACIGVEVRGADPASITNEGIAALRHALAEHALVLFRGVPRSVEDQRAIARWFGSLDERGGAPRPGDGPEKYISNTHPDGVARSGALLKHSDFCFADPLPMLCLYAEAAPDEGGETVFADARAALARLDAVTRRRLDGLRAEFVYDYRNDEGTTRFRVADAPDAPRGRQLVVLEHPTTTRAVLYVNELMTDRIVDLPDDESEALLAELFAAFDDTEVQYIHRWQQHDLVVWDNIALQHGRRDFPPHQARSLRRLQIS
jgi:taurine dioxygenase